MKRLLTRLRTGAALALLTVAVPAAWAQVPTYLYLTRGSADAPLDALLFQGLNISQPLSVLASGDAAFNQPNDVVVDATNRYVYVADQYESSGAILRFDLDGSNRTVIVPATAGATYNGLALDGAQQLLYFTQGSATPTLDALKKVNLTTLAVTTLASGNANFEQPGDLVIDAANQQLYLVDAFESTGALLRFDATTGTSRTVVVPPTTGATYGGLALDRANRKLYFTQGSPMAALDALKVVNLNTLAVTMLAGGDTNFQQPGDLAYDPATQWLYLADEYQSTGPVLRFNTDGTNRTEIVPPTANATYAGVTLFSGSLPDLVVNATQSIPAGAYHDVTITGTGVGTLGGNVSVTGTFRVQAGGELLANGACSIITGAGNFILDAGATLHICQPLGLQASGAAGQVQVTGMRSFSADATYSYEGGSGQVTGNALPATVRNLTVNSVAGVMLSQPLAVRQMLRIDGSGGLNLGASMLTLLSDATGTAMVVNNGLGTVNGTVTVQRYLDPGTAMGLGYRHLSSPVQSTTFADLTTTGFTPVVNAAYNTAPNPVLVTPAPNIFGYNEALAPTNSTFSKGYFSPAALTDPMMVGRGYSVYMNPVTYDLVGSLNSGNIVLTGLSKTGNFNSSTQKSGWHLLGNPFPSPLDWDLIPIPPGMSNSVSVFKSTGGANGIYLTRAGGVGSLTDGLIAMGQGFFTRVLSGAPLNFTIPSSARPTTYANPAHYRMAPAARPLLSLTLHAGDAPAGEVDEATIYFPTDATAGFDAAFDGARPAHNVGVPTLATLSAGEELAVNALPESSLGSGFSLPLLIDLPRAGRYELTLSKLENLPGQEVVLYDAQTHTRYPLHTQPRLTFTADRAGEDRTRFTLLMSRSMTQMPVAAAGQLILWPNPARETVRIQAEGLRGPVQLVDVTGRIVRNTEITTDHGSLDFSLSGLRPGVYTVRAGALTQRLIIE